MHSTMDTILMCLSLCLAMCPLLTVGHMIHYRSADPSGSLLNQEYTKGPTTPNISDIFIGRCNEHVQCLQQDQCVPDTLQGTCGELWTKFVGAFAYKDPCQAGYDDYDDVIAAAMPYTYENKTLFWSGIPSLALNGGRVTMTYTILEESLPGYIANSLTWCGQTEAPGIDYVNRCPARCASNNETMYTFWKAASRAFARQAKGIVAVALDGSRTDAFRNTSTFATNELPNFNPQTVTHVNILLVYDISLPGDNRKALCDKGSIQNLQTLLTTKGFSYTCIEDPSDFKFLQCAGDPTNARCIPSCNSAIGPGASTALVFIAHLVLQVVTRSRDLSTLWLE